MVGHQTLAQALDQADNVVDFLRDQDWPPITFPITPEFTNWRDEQRAWRTGVALMDQSHHMTQLFMHGNDLNDLLASISPNTFKNFRPGRAKQMIAVNKDGFLIGDGILFFNSEGEEGRVLVGHHILIDWVRFHIEKAQDSGKHVHYRLDPNSNMRNGDPTLYRYELQGPDANAVMERLFDGPVPELKFFHIGDFTIAGKHVKALRHGMAGQPGFEFYGPYADHLDVHAALMEAGSDWQIRRVGAKAYSSSPLESGWIPTPLPAIFSDDCLEYRRWLPAARVGALAGSLYSKNIADYYTTPYDIGLGRSVRFDHEFHGREALERHAALQERRKVTLFWDSDDVADIVRSQLVDGTPAKYLDFPKARYGFYQMDEVVQQGKQVGVSTDAGYVAYPQRYMSLATIDNSIRDGDTVEIIWGEDPISAKPQTDRNHKQTRIRATVLPAPYQEYARTTYRGLSTPS